ncbi:pyruvate kinase [Pelagibius litoralis]|uniref:Pyruvate kinase n=1 Tax=Pelagibius litoralis TaxID=374515 RepID=A0A967C5T8_9PROT|nr:pyruvate kinase [Pelagibius litoralis]NIA69090.1 pyruvate kinase [Pelagibius litoralis]
MRRSRKAKIVATLGPASSDKEEIRALFSCGADVFRLNFSHGSHEDHKARYDTIREIERELDRPIGIMADMQGPKLRIGTVRDGAVDLEAGQPFRLDLDPAVGDEKRACLPHHEIFAAISPGTSLLIDDGKLRLEVQESTPDHAITKVVTGGPLRDRKGVNLPGVILPISPLTEKDRADLEFALGLGVDWVALSFVQRPEDLTEARRLIGDRAAIMTKVEKPAALDCLPQLVALSDAMMVARGDLGVEMPPETIPARQKQIIHASRLSGVPVVVATQMLESMITAPTPTRAEASDVATAIYDGADAVMLSAETAAGDYPNEAVSIMDRIIQSTEGDPSYLGIIHARDGEAEATGADAISTAAAQVAATIATAAIVNYTMSGSTALRAARQRPNVPILVLTNELRTARRLAVLWGAHCVHTEDVSNTQEMVEKASRIAVREGFANLGDNLAITAGVPFKTPGTTNMLRIAKVDH